MLGDLLQIGAYARELVIPLGGMALSAASGWYAPQAAVQMLVFTELERAACDPKRTIKH